MSELLTPEDVEARAQAAGISISTICQNAGIARSTFTRWKRGDTQPTLAVYLRIRDALPPITEPQERVA